MAELAIEVVHRDWRALQGLSLEKPLTPRGNLWFHRHNPRRARGDNCYDHDHRGEGRRVVALERLTRRDKAVDQLDEAVDSGIEDDDFEPEGPSSFCSTGSVKWLRIRLADEMQKISSQERLEVCLLQRKLRHARRRVPDRRARCRLLKDWIKFRESLGPPRTCKDIVLLLETRLELQELQDFLYAA